MATCFVCGKEYDGTNTCPACNFKARFSVGELSEEQREQQREKALSWKKALYGDTRVYIRGYHFEEENGELVEKFHQDIPVAENIYSMDVEDVSWSNVIFAKQPAGESVDLTVIIDGDTSKLYSVTVLAPITDGMWKVGLVVKPGLEACIRVGDENSYADSQNFSLKG